MINERINKLRSEMKKRNIDIYIVPTADYHASEYVGEYFKERAFITGFTGSAGTAVITMEEACLWTDGRYFIQAARQLEGSEVVLQKMGEPGVPTVEGYVKEHMQNGTCIGFDGRCMCAREADDYRKIANANNGSVYNKEDLIDAIWEERPKRSAKEVWILEQKYAGETTESKIARITKELEKEGADAHLISSLYDIAWILNLRGDDIRHVPVLLSYLWLSKTKRILFVNPAIINDKVRHYLDELQITVEDYDKVCDILPTLEADCIWMDDLTVNDRLYESLPKSANIIKKTNPAVLMRAIKNETEIENTKQAHIKDGVAFTKFMYYVKKNIGKVPMTEITASDYLENCRREQENCIDLSFDTICAYGANAAMMHYSAKPESCATLKPEGFLLVDSGGHYLEGTTDITRTIVLGDLTDKMIDYFTLVLRCNLRLAAAKFPKGCCGQNLDVLSRGPVWERGLDYRCGTGHGVGHILNVHEGPNGFRWQVTDAYPMSPIVPGMITTDEPGLYVENEFGIRTENELLCVEDECTEYGQFYSFESVTIAPIDLDAVDVTKMNQKEIDALNAYHKNVYDTLSPYLDDEIKEWLKEITRAV